MKKQVIGFLCALSIGHAAQADTFEEYKVLGQSIYQELESDATQEQLQEAVYELTDLGFQIMELYLVKYPDCSEQYVQVLAENQMMRTLSYEELDVRYHDGVGLPESSQAPRNCYLGRSMVAHPYMALALFADGLTSSEKKAALHEVEEVVERADRLKQILQN